MFKASLGSTGRTSSHNRNQKTNKHKLKTHKVFKKGKSTWPDLDRHAQPRELRQAVVPRSWGEPGCAHHRAHCRRAGLQEAGHHARPAQPAGQSGSREDSSCLPRPSAMSCSPWCQPTMRHHDPLLLWALDVRCFIPAARSRLTGCSKPSQAADLPAGPGQGRGAEDLSTRGHDIHLTVASQARAQGQPPGAPGVFLSSLHWRAGLSQPAL